MIPKRTWHIDAIHWGGGGKPTHITVQLDDPDLYPAVKRFADDEELKVVPSETGQSNERWIGYPREDFEQAKLRLDQRITNLYWENRWAKESQFKVGDKVQIVEVPTFTTSQQPIFVQMYDEGMIIELVGFDLYVISFQNSGTITGIHARHLQLI